MHHKNLPKGRDYLTNIFLFFFYYFILSSLCSEGLIYWASIQNIEQMLNRVITWKQFMNFASLCEQRFPTKQTKEGEKKNHHALASIIIPLLFYQLCVLLQHLRRPSVTSKQNTMIISALAFMIFTGLYWLKQTSSFTLHLWDPSHLQAECCIAEVDALLCWVSKSCWEAPNTAAATTLSEHIFLQPFKWVASCAEETT